MMSKRLKFFTAHLAVSFLVLSLVALLVFKLWYPQPLAGVTGILHIFLILLVIDVVVGPLLCLLVYKEGKKTLKFDLSVIILIQISAFIFGLYSVAAARPIWIVFNMNSFDLIRGNDTDTRYVKDIPTDFKNASWFGPRYVAVLPSTDKQQFKTDMFEGFAGLTLSQKPQRYVPLTQAAQEIRASAKDLSLLYRFNKQSDVDALLKQYPAADAWLPLQRVKNEKVVLINKQKVEAIKVVDLNPKNQ